MLQLDNVVVYHDGIQAIDSVSLRVDPGRMVALIGPNGAGKTTLLNAISGFNRLRAGSIKFDGRDISGLAPYAIARAGVVQVPEGRQILASLTVEENLLVGGVAARGRGGSFESDSRRVFELFPILDERRHQVSGQLSGGQQQMLAIGRAMMGRPKLLLLDEPSLGLAPTVVSQVFEVLRLLHSQGLSIFLIEQNAVLALEATDVTYVIERGRIVRRGTSAELRHDPRIIEHYLGSLA